MTTMWTFRDYETWRGTDITGYKVQALDGDIGSVDEATFDTGSSWIVVDTGPWIFGKKVLLPAGVIDRIDATDRRVLVSHTKDDIQNAPDWDETRYRDPAYQTEVGSYYQSRTPMAAGTRGPGM
jgi:hypothetical protein